MQLTGPDVDQDNRAARQTMDHSRTGSESAQLYQTKAKTATDVTGMFRETYISINV
jgi:hypothetical protein